MTHHLDTLDALAARVPDGAMVALPPEYSLVPTALVKALVRGGVRDLHLVAVPIGGYAADLLMGAGCVKVMEAAAVSLGEAGLAPNFTRLVQAGELEMRDTTCPALHTALQAAEKGVPFMPLGGIIGSDLVDHRPDWKVVDDPMGAGHGPILLLPAITPDVALIHGMLADEEGNVWVGKRRELFTIAHAAKTTLATYEKRHPGNLLEDPVLSAGTIPSLYFGAITPAERGAAPLGVPDHYTADLAHLAAYAREAKTEEGFRAYLAREVLDPGERAAG